MQEIHGYLDVRRGFFGDIADYFDPEVAGSLGELIERLVRPQLRLGIGSMMSGGEIQKQETFKQDLADGIGPTKHLGLIAGRSTWGSAEYDWAADSFKNDKVLAHAKLMHASLPTVVC